MALRVDRKRRLRKRWILGVLFLAALVWGTNSYLFSRPAAAALAADPRTTGMALESHLRFYVDPATWIIDLRKAEVGDPADLLRGLLRAVKSVDDATWIPSQVLLLRAGKPVYSVAGGDLSRLAYQFSVSRNPGAILNGLVRALRAPTGGGLPPLTVTDAASAWASAH